jgi:hypothetical protein
MDDDLAAHCHIVTRRFREGKVIPFLGAGVNVCGRPDGTDWRKSGALPSGQELASYLAESYAYPASETRDLLRVSQYVQAVTGGTALYDELHSLFDRPYKPNVLHHMLAQLPRAMREDGVGPATRQPLLVTTNYDDALEKAFDEAGEEYDLVAYMARGEHRGKFLHHTPAGDVRVIDPPNTYRELSLDRRTVIMKIHGAVDRANPDADSFVITEDHYIDYLAQSDISNIVPAALMAVMNESHFLFLGYSLRDWNLRVILQRIWGHQPFEEKFTSWAIQKGPSKLEERLWRRRNVEILDVDLEVYVQALAARGLGGAGASNAA